jgi:hypothetical protein
VLYQFLMNLAQKVCLVAENPDIVAKSLQERHENHAHPEWLVVRKHIIVTIKLRKNHAKSAKKVK